MLIALVCTIYLIVAIALILLVLLQKGKGFGAESSSGSGFSGSYFGSSGADLFMKKLTIGISVIFLALGFLMIPLFQKANRDHRESFEFEDETQEALEVERADEEDDAVQSSDQILDEEDEDEEEVQVEQLDSDPI